MTTPVVEIFDMCYSCNGQDIVHAINLTLHKDDFVAIVGPNGGGKTTLLKLILGILKPTRGTIRINGREPCSHTISIGYVPQNVNHNLSFPATALDVVIMGKYEPSRRFQRANTKQNRSEALEVMSRLGVEHYASRKITTLSGGQRQRVLIARALVSRPQLLVLDEPTASIDSEGQNDFYKLLKELNKELTILMVSHDLITVASYAKSFACLNRSLHYHQSIDSSAAVLEAFHSCSLREYFPAGIAGGTG